jgi:hypothetical protein
MGPSVLHVSAYTGQLGGMLAMAFASGATATFGYSWAFFVLPARALSKELKADMKAFETRVQDERASCDKKIASIEERHRLDNEKLDNRIRELEMLLNMKSILQQTDQIRQSATRLLHHERDQEDEG